MYSGVGQKSTLIESATHHLGYELKNKNYNNGLRLEVASLLNQIYATMDRCVQCGAKLDRKDSKPTLRCSICLDGVKRELLGKQDKPYTFYFKYYRKKRGMK